MAEEAEDLQDELLPEGDVAPGDLPAGDGETTTEAPPSAEEIARELGWKPETEWKGPKDNWTPAADFIRHKVKKAERVGDEIRGVRETLDRVSRTSAKIVERAVMDERAKLEARFYDAVEAGDSGAAFAVSQELARADTAPVVEASEPPAVTDFKSRNPWFAANKAARAVAIAAAQSIANIGENDPEVQFEAAERAVRRDFPELFETDPPPPRRDDKRPAAVNAPQSRAARPAPRSERTEADLPLEARRVGEDFVRRGRVESLRAYAKIYFEENA